MESLVPFKTFTFWNKDQQAEVRRFGIEKTLVTNFQYLSAKLQDVYPGLKGKKFHVSWKDEEDDYVRISSDEDLLIALSNMRENMVKLNIFCVDSDEKEGEIFVNAPNTAAAGNVASSSDAKAKHLGVICDGCDSEIEGFRYKCTCCFDYDLCSTCEAACVHPEHCMVRVPSPAMPREFIKAAIKRSRHILKNLATPAGDGAYKRHRRDRSGDRRRDHHGEPHHRRARGSWLDTFATYMNEFVDLAGGIDLDVDNTGQDKGTGAKPKETQTQEQPKQTKESVNAQTQQPESEQRAEAAAAANQPPRCPLAPQPLNFAQIQKLLQDFYMPTQACHANASASSASGQPAPGNTAEQPAPGNTAGAEASATAADSSTETISKPTRSGEGSMDRTDDWTMINKEKDLMDTSENNAVDPTPPIGFNLPLEFQTRMSINGAAATSIYPPLNVATAVMNPKEPEAMNPEAPKPAEAPKRPSPPPAPQPTAPTPAPRERHPLAHIDAAIEQMLFMGFTNEGGWLTKLLESKDGNIAEVIDLLTPHPK